MCRRKLCAPAGLLLLSACVLLDAPHVPGNTWSGRTLSCCGELNIPITKGCLNIFLIGKEPLAQVDDTEVTVMEPFEHRQAEGVMHNRKCRSFTHEIICDVNAHHASEEKIDYTVTPCTKEPEAPDAAGTIQGLKLPLLLSVALLTMFA